jgi:hypothetical protein
LPSWLVRVGFAHAWESGGIQGRICGYCERSSGRAPGAAAPAEGSKIALYIRPTWRRFPASVRLGGAGTDVEDRRELAVHRSTQRGWHSGRRAGESIMARVKTAQRDGAVLAHRAVLLATNDASRAAFDAPEISIGASVNWWCTQRSGSQRWRWVSSRNHRPVDLGHSIMSGPRA